MIKLNWTEDEWERMRAKAKELMLRVREEENQYFEEESRPLDKFKMTDCKERYLYRIHSRNLKLGVFHSKGAFLGIREKFGSRYLFDEYHWDQGPPFGTVKPLQELNRVPDEVGAIERDNEELFKYLEREEFLLDSETKREENERDTNESNSSEGTQDTTSEAEAAGVGDGQKGREG